MKNDSPNVATMREQLNSFVNCSYVTVYIDEVHVLEAISKHPLRQPTQYLLTHTANRSSKSPQSTIGAAY